MVRYGDGWHEAKVGIVTGWDGQHSQAPSYVAAREGPDCFGPRLLAEGARRGALEVVGWEQPPGIDQRLAGVVGPSLAVLRPTLVLGDGAPWTWNLAAEHFGQRTELVPQQSASLECGQGTARGGLAGDHGLGPGAANGALGAGRSGPLERVECRSEGSPHHSPGLSSA